MIDLGHVVDQIVARKARYLIRREQSDRRHLLEVVLKVAGTRVAL